jgi:hypothetical protein
MWAISTISDCASNNLALSTPVHHSYGGGALPLLTMTTHAASFPFFFILATLECWYRGRRTVKLAPVSFVTPPPLCCLNDHRVPLNLHLTLTHGLLPCERLACNLPLLEDNAFEDVVCGEIRGGIHKKIRALEKIVKKVPHVFFQNWCSGT